MEALTLTENLHYLYDLHYLPTLFASLDFTMCITYYLHDYLESPDAPSPLFTLFNNCPRAVHKWISYLGSHLEI